MAPETCSCLAYPSSPALPRRPGVNRVDRALPGRRAAAQVSGSTTAGGWTLRRPRAGLIWLTRRTRSGSTGGLSRSSQHAGCRSRPRPTALRPGMASEPSAWMSSSSVCFQPYPRDDRCRLASRTRDAYASLYKSALSQTRWSVPVSARMWIPPAFAASSLAKLVDDAIEPLLHLAAQCLDSWLAAASHADLEPRCHSRCPSSRATCDQRSTVSPARASCRPSCAPG